MPILGLDNFSQIVNACSEWNVDRKGGPVVFDKATETVGHIGNEKGGEGSTIVH